MAKPKTPEPPSVLRHPIVELAPDQWLFPLMDRTIVYDAKTEAEKPCARVVIVRRLSVTGPGEIPRGCHSQAAPEGLLIAATKYIWPSLFYPLQKNYLFDHFLSSTYRVHAGDELDTSRCDINLDGLPKAERVQTLWILHFEE